MKRLLIIPAAGPGSRLRSKLPKPLYPVDGRPMIDYLLELYSPWVGRFIVVASPATADRIEAHCSVQPADIELAVQPSPTGMLDAILAPHQRVAELEPESVWVTWCDQIAVHPATIAELAASSGDRPEAALILPTVRRRDPYIHLRRDHDGEIVEVLQRREGDRMPAVGESDMGLFCLSGVAYRDLLPLFSKWVGPGSGTAERNFLPFIPWLSGRGTVRTFAARSEIEATGVNTPEDALALERHFRGA